MVSDEHVQRPPPPEPAQPLCIWMNWGEKTARRTGGGLKCGWQQETEREISGTSPDRQKGTGRSSLSPSTGQEQPRPSTSSGQVRGGRRAAGTREGARGTTQTRLILRVQSSSQLANGRIDSQQRGSFTSPSSRVESIDKSGCAPHSPQGKWHGLFWHLHCRPRLP